MPVGSLSHSFFYKLLLTYLTTVSHVKTRNKNIKISWKQEIRPISFYGIKETKYMFIANNILTREKPMLIYCHLKKI